MLLSLIDATQSYPWAASLGVGGAIAGVLIWVNQTAEKRNAEERKKSEARYSALTDRVLDTLEDVTKAITQVTAAVEHNTVSSEATRQAIERLRWKP